jgi:hypothetical protein
MDIESLEKGLRLYVKELEIILSYEDSSEYDVVTKNYLKSAHINKILNNPEIRSRVGATLTEKAILKDLNQLRIDQSSEENKMINALDILSGVNNHRWLVHGLIPNGLLFIFAAPKTGKSDLICHLQRAVVTGGEFLGYPATKGTVLSYALEESDNSMRIKFKCHGLGKPGVRSVLEKGAIMIRRSLDLANQFNMITEDVEKLLPNVVIIDTAISAMSASNISINDVAFSTPFRRLQALALEYNCSVIVLHHSNKSGQSAGTFSLLSIGSGNWKMERVEDEDRPNISTIDINSRDFGRKRLMIERVFQPDYTYTYKILQEETGDAQKEHYLKLILRELYPYFKLTEKDLLEKIDMDVHTFQEVVKYGFDSSVLDIAHDSTDTALIFISEDFLKGCENSSVYRAIFNAAEISKEVSLLLNSEDATLEKLQMLYSRYKEEYQNWDELSKMLIKSLSISDILRFNALKKLNLPKYHKTEQEILGKVCLLKVSRVINKNDRALYFYNCLYQNTPLVIRDQTQIIESDIESLLKGASDNSLSF